MACDFKVFEVLKVDYFSFRDVAAMYLLHSLIKQFI